MESYEVVGDTDTAEGELRRLGLASVRVRQAGDTALLEMPSAQLALIAHDPLRSEVLRAVRAAGFKRVAVLIDQGG